MGYLDSDGNEWYSWDERDASQRRINTRNSDTTGSGFIVILIVIAGAITLLMNILARYYFLPIIICLLYYRFYRNKFSKNNIIGKTQWKLVIQKTILFIPFLILTSAFYDGVKNHYKYYKIQTNIEGKWHDKGYIYEIEFSDTYIKFTDNNAKSILQGYYSLEYDISRKVILQIYNDSTEIESNIHPFEQFELGYNDGSILLITSSRNAIVFYK